MFALKVVWICLFISVSFCDEMDLSNIRPLLKPAISVCQTESSVDMDQLKTLSISQPLSHDLSCFIECVLRKFDLIQDDKFSTDKANSYVDRFVKHGDELISQVKRTLWEIAQQKLKTILICVIYLVLCSNVWVESYKKLDLLRNMVPLNKTVHLVMI